MEVEIRTIRTLSDLRRCHRIQRATWGYSDLMVIPYPQLLSASHNGGVLLGAYLDQELVGFVYGYLGMTSGKLYLFSQRMGVLPEFQGQGIGFKLKLAQRIQMLRHGIELIVWTYDPLEGKNATLNIVKLGAIVRTYARNIYGTVQNPLQMGLAMDRFLAEWPLLSDRVLERVQGYSRRAATEEWLAGPTYPIVNYISWDGDLPRPMAAELDLSDDALLVQVPPDLQSIKRTDLTVARGWRKITRGIFETYFRRGYVITGFASSRQPRTANLYKLENVSFPSPIDFSSWATGIIED
jgi:predicted GNAT superfamily acetyltransferase